MRKSMQTSVVAFTILLFDVIFLMASDTDETRSTISKSLSRLQQTAKTYTLHRKCFSCHHQSLPVMTFDLAVKKGFEISPDVIKHQTKFTIAHFQPKIAVIKKGLGVGGASFTAGYALFSLHIGHWPQDETTNALVNYLKKKQKKDGRWRVVSKRPPMEDNDFTSTALSVKGLKLYGEKDDVSPHIEKARTWLVDHPAKSNEELTYRLWGLKWANAKEKHVEQATQNLLKKQREDGGWGQIDSMKSDAYATGQALVVLHEAGGIGTSHAAYQKGIAFLQKLRRDDGTWLVSTRSSPIQTYFESGFPYGKNQFVSTAATCWATMAILHTLPNLKQGSSPPK